MHHSLRLLPLMVLATLTLAACDGATEPAAATQATSAPVTPVEESKAEERPRPAYRIHAGDVLHITVWKEDGMDQEVTVLPDGTIDFPLAGNITAAGKTSEQLESRIRKRLVRMIPRATVTVVVKETRGNSVSVIGQVARPGDIVMTRPLTVMQALSQAGGLSTFADEDDIAILRTVDGVKKSMPFDYSDVADGDALDTDITLEPGDVIIVPTASLF